MLDFNSMAARQAQELIYDAWETFDLKQQYQLAQRALQLDADCLDAYSLLAQHASSLQAAYDLYAEAVYRGEGLLKQELVDDIGHFWGIIETRPFMRVHLELAICEWHLGQHETAIQRLWRHLTLNANDNQGVRDILLGFLQAQADDAGIDRLCAIFPFMEQRRDTPHPIAMLDLPLQWVVTRDNLVRTLVQANIRSLQDLMNMPLNELQAIKGIGKKTAPRLQASARAYLLRAPHWFNSLPVAVNQPLLLLDIRVYPDFNPQRPWGFGLRYPDGRTRFYIVAPERETPTSEQLAGHIVDYYPDDQQIWQALLEQQRVTGLHLACWGKQIRRHLKATAPRSVQSQLKLHDLHQQLLDTVALPLQTLGLQEVSTYLGHEGWGEDKKPFLAHMGYIHWLHDDRLDELQRALAMIDFYLDAVAQIHQWAIAQQSA